MKDYKSKAEYDADDHRDLGQKIFDVLMVVIGAACIFIIARA